MPSDRFTETTKDASLRAAWRKVYNNGISSNASETREEVIEFAKDSDRHIKRIQRELRDGTFIFRPSKGKRVPKKNKVDFRPIVIAPIETRIVQRAVLDNLMNIRRLHPYIDTPYSFGGVRKARDEQLGAVPAAIRSVLDARQKGLEYVCCADIDAFFTRIRKSKVKNIICDHVRNENFIRLFTKCIDVELSNLEELQGDRHRFPIGDLGVAQGSSLSPLLGNIVLHDFDKQMNSENCACFRYIDDLIILGPSEEDVKSQFCKAREILRKNDMDFSDEKSSGAVKTFQGGFSFLGIELENGLIRPDGEAVGRLKNNVRKILKDSEREMSKDARSISSDFALVPTLMKLSQVLQGWAKHYRFCNDLKKFRAIDDYVDEQIRQYLGVYTRRRAQKEHASRELLGVTKIENIDWNPMRWK